MKKIEIKICMGTTCFIMCNSELQDIEEEISPKILPYVNILGSSCLGFCKDAKFHRIPCATINGELVGNVYKTELLKRIDEAVTEMFSHENNQGENSHGK